MDTTLNQASWRYHDAVHTWWGGFSYTERQKQPRHEFIRVTGQTVVNLNKLHEDTKKKLAKHMKRGYGSATKGAYAGFWAFVCENNPVFTMPHTYLSTREFRLAFYADGDRQEMMSLIDPLLIMIAKGRKQEMHTTETEETVGGQKWFVMHARFGGNCPRALGRLARPFLADHKAKRLQVAKWLLSGQCEPITIELDTKYA